MKFAFIMAVKVNVLVFRAVTPGRYSSGYKCFGGTCCLQIILFMEFLEEDYPSCHT
jgi:hypothetical protein